MAARRPATRDHRHEAGHSMNATAYHHGSRRADWFRDTATAFAGVLLTLITLWLSGQFEGVSRAEAIEIAEHGQYATDRLALFKAIEANTNNVAALASETKQLTAQLAELIGEMRGRHAPQMGDP